MRIEIEQAREYAIYLTEEEIDMLSNCLEHVMFLNPTKKSKKKSKIEIDRYKYDNFVDALCNDIYDALESEE